MGRPSVKAQRTEEILNAFESCVARYGVEGTTLERIAEASGLQRSLLRYHVGNRDKMVEALTERHLEQSKRQTRELVEYLPETDRCEALIGLLFGDYSEEDLQRVRVASALISSADNYPDVGKKYRRWYDGFVKKVAEVVSDEYDKASNEDCWAVAVGLVGIYFNAASMAGLKLSGAHQSGAIDAARRLLHSL